MGEIGQECVREWAELVKSVWVQLGLGFKKIKSSYTFNFYTFAYLYLSLLFFKEEWEYERHTDLWHRLHTLQNALLKNNICLM